jgi:membrane protein DedA with SNARE-associated domain
MNLNAILNYIHLYGYLVIFICLFFGIVGIPAPEESLLFLVGVLSVKHRLSFGIVVIISILGVFIGMLTAYVCGKYVGTPFLEKFGKYVGMTSERLEKVSDYYSKNVRKTIVFGFYLPGLRQISPYFAGITNIPFRKFLLLSLLGTLLWTVPFIVVGFYTGRVFHINPAYVPWLGVVSLFLFIIYGWIQYSKTKKAR